MSENKRNERRPNLSVIALVSFSCSFVAARIFTSVSPTTVFATAGFHIHHFWYGIVMLAIGGWLGISYAEPRIDRLAAILFGAGGGLIGDEVGILLTFQSESYWTGLSFTFIIVLVTLSSILILVGKFSRTILKEFNVLSGSRGGFYTAVLLGTISIAFLMDTSDPFIVVATGSLAILACLTVLSFFVKTIRRKLSRNREPKSSK